MTTAQEDVAKIYRSLYLIRSVEREVARIYPTDKIKSPVHLSIGQEAASVAVCSLLEHDDVVYGTYRGHALYLAKGGDLNAMVAELYGKATGCAKGKGGSMHLIDVAAGVMGTSAVVGTTIPHAAGHALAFQMRRKPQVVVCFLGDGAVEEGVFHETMNFAALKKLPVLFVCENNLYAIHAPLATRQSTAIAERVRSYGIPSVRIDDGDPWKIRSTVAPWIESMRRGQGGPYFVECVAYRWLEHVGPNEDFKAGYRSLAEAEPWYACDPLAAIGRQLDEQQRTAIEREVTGRLEEAFAFAERSPFPDVDQLHTHVYKEMS